MESICNKSCINVDHGYFINTALKVLGLTTEEQITFSHHICQYCDHSKDELGRTALHVAAMLGKTDLCKWLLDCKQSKIDEKDLESGYTALHRSIFYGHLETAVYLISLGANLKILDYNGLNPLNHAVLDNLQNVDELNSPTIHVWGSNLNYTLGIQQSKPFPDIMESFHKLYPHKEVSSIHMEKFHTVILTKDGEVFSLGHGQGGRLGLGSDKTILKPTPVKFNKRGLTVPVKIIKAALGRDHSLFLSEQGDVWTCGLNTNRVLGVEPVPEKLLTPWHVMKLKSPMSGVCCSRYHSVAWNRHSVYTWGLNGGQLGHDESIMEDSFVIFPKLVTKLSPKCVIESVAASIGSTVVATSKEVIVFHNFQPSRVLKRNIGISSIETFGGKITKVDEKHHELHVLILQNNGKISLWRETNPQLTRCIFSIPRTFIIKQVKLNANGLVFITQEQEVYTGTFKYPKKHAQIDAKSKQFNNFLDSRYCVTVQVEQVPRVYGAKFIACDLEGHNFASLNINYASLLTSLPEIGESTMNGDCKRLLDDSLVESDGSIRVKGFNFETHKFIIANQSVKLLKMVQNDEFLDVPKEIFREILNYIYNGTCAFTNCGSLSEELLNSIKNLDFKTKDPLKGIQSICKHLEIKSLVTDLEKFIYSDGFIGKNHKKRFWPRIIHFDYTDFSDLCDVTIKCKSPNQEVKAHKCILASRSEFFMNLLSVRWTHDAFTVIDLPYPIESIKFLLNYLYSDQVDLDAVDLDSLLDLLVLADHILLDRLVQICEFTICKLLTVKNALKILTVAFICNANQLKATCMEFICLNMAMYLEMKTLELLDEDILWQLSQFYAVWNKKLSRRSVSLIGEQTIKEAVREVCREHPLNMDIISPPKMHKKKRRSKNVREDAIGEEIMEEKIVINKFNDMEINVEKSSASSTPIRIQAISKAHERIKEMSVEDDEDYVNLSSPKEFPNLGDSYDGAQDIFLKSPVTTPNGQKTKIKVSRISQRERKRLLSENNNESIKETPIAESPKNPWNMNFESSPSTSLNVFGQIVTEEKKQKENLNRMKSKLLMYTQMEDKAIEDLSKFYGVDTVFDEIIEVQRVDCGSYATPVWVQK